jgi:serine protease Do
MKHLLSALLLLASLNTPLSAESLGKELSRAFIDVAKNATPAVVFIRAEISPQFEQFGYSNENDLFGEEFFNRFFGTPKKGGGGRGRSSVQVSQGSGFIVSEDGYVVTNYHVVRDATKLTICMSDGGERELPATLVGGDPSTDVALLKIDERPGVTYPFIKFGNSADLEVGEWVVAIGSPFQLEATVTVGVVSAKGRQNLQITDLEDFIQTDAAINPGNSGGPLINLDGEVIGINTAIISPSGAYIGIGFAVPSQIASAIMSQVMKTGIVSRGYLGVSIQSIDKDLQEAFDLKNGEGALIADVVKDSPAEKAGLKSGDVVESLDGKAIKSAAQLQNNIMLMEPGSQITLGINRKGKKMKIAVSLGNHSKQYSQETAISAKLGFTVENLTPEMAQKFKISPNDQGVVISEVQPTSLAGKAGLKPGYVIMAVNHSKVTSITEFNNALTSVGDSKRILLLVKSGERVRFFSLKTP